MCVEDLAHWIADFSRCPGYTDLVCNCYLATKSRKFNLIYSIYKMFKKGQLADVMFKRCSFEFDHYIDFCALGSNDASRRDFFLTHPENRWRSFYNRTYRQSNMILQIPFKSCYILEFPVNFLCDISMKIVPANQRSRMWMVDTDCKYQKRNRYAIGRSCFAVITNPILENTT